MAIATMQELLEAGIHFGHQTRRWHPKMARYIYGQRHGIYIIDLQHTLRQLYEAYGLVRDISARGGNVLFVGTKKQAVEPVQQEALRCGMYYVNNRWLGGTLTNWKTIKSSINKLLYYEELESSGRIEKYGKKEQIVFRKQREKLEANLSGIKNMPGVPEVMFVIDAKREDIAVNEAHRLKIPCIGIVDTNCDPDVVDYPIPGNDDAIRSVQLFCSVIADAVLEGRQIYEKVRAEEAEKRRAKAKDAPKGTADKEAEAAEEAPEAAATVSEEAAPEAAPETAAVEAPATVNATSAAE